MVSEVSQFNWYCFWRGGRYKFQGFHCLSDWIASCALRSTTREHSRPYMITTGGSMNGLAVWDQPLMSSVMWREWCRREVSIRMMTLQHRLSPSIEQWCLHHNTVWHMVGIVHCWNQWILMFLVFHVKRTAGQIANESICKGGLAPSTWFGLSTTELWEHHWWFWRTPQNLVNVGTEFSFSMQCLTFTYVTKIHFWVIIGPTKILYNYTSNTLNELYLLRMWKQMQCWLCLAPSTPKCSCLWTLLMRVMMAWLGLEPTSSTTTRWNSSISLMRLNFTTKSPVKSKRLWRRSPRIIWFHCHPHGHLIFWHLLESVGWFSMKFLASK